MENFTPNKEQIENLLKSEGLYKQIMIGEEQCWKLLELNDGNFTHIIHEVDKSRPFSYRTNFYVNDKTCLKSSLNPYTNECECEDLSTKWQEILSK